MYMLVPINDMDAPNTTNLIITKSLFTRLGNANPFYDELLLIIGYQKLTILHREIAGGSSQTNLHL